MYPLEEKVKAQLPFPREDFSFPQSGLSSLGLTVQPRPTASARQLSDLGWQSRSRKRKVLSRKRKLGLDLFLSGIYLFPALQNIYSFFPCESKIIYNFMNCLKRLIPDFCFDDNAKFILSLVEIKLKSIYQKKSPLSEMEVRP